MVLIREPNGESSSENENIEQTSSVGPRKTRSKRKRQESQTNPTTNGNSNNSNDENPENLLKMLLDAVKILWHQIKSASNFLMIDLGGYQVFDRLAQWCVQHPQIAIFLLAAALVAFLPILLLIGFALSTVLMTFTGILVIEGTLLTILSMMLFGLLGALAIVLLFFAVVAVATYFGFARIYDLYGNTETHRSALRNFLQKERNLRYRTMASDERNTNSNSRKETINHTNI